MFRPGAPDSSRKEQKILGAPLLAQGTGAWGRENPNRKIATVDPAAAYKTRNNKKQGTADPAS